LAVTREARGRFVGTKLVTAVIERARESEVETLYLETSPEDQRVISFFESLGFKKMENNPLPARYKRPRITMCLNL
ncbi:MAG TPA: GNAT family N-acetyltransferase, partial [Acidobacteriota bacterium]|nr:GNAT family N-acetyltransferase [Acidobacteriota bacterium]